MSSKPLELLPDRWVQKIWTTMRNTYGASFDRQWECPVGVDPQAHVGSLMSHWAEELGRFGNVPEAIGYALENLPDFPPNLVQFKAICNRAPGPVFKVLPQPEADKEVVAKALAKAAEAIKPQHDILFRQREHMRMEMAGERLSMRQREFWRIALRNELLRKYAIDTKDADCLAHLRQVFQPQQRAAA